jgi:hypothetical protein
MTDFKDWGWVNGMSCQAFTAFSDARKEHEKAAHEKPNEHRHKCTSTASRTEYACSCGFAWKADCT